MESIFPVVLCIGAIFVFILVVTLLVLLGMFAKQSLHDYSEHRRMEILSMTRNIYSLSPKEFEEYVGIIFSNHGYQVQHTGRSGDHGIDLLMTSPKGHKVIAQCKRYDPSKKVGPEIVRSLQGAMVQRNIDTAFLVTTSEFTKGAYKEAAVIHGLTIKMMDGKFLSNEAKRIGLPGQVMQWRYLTPRRISAIIMGSKMLLRG
jgi:restriction system protein